MNHKNKFQYSVVIPVFNSEAIVDKTIDRILAFFEEHGWRYEIILVNDGSQDGSWNIISSRAQQHQNIMAINLLRNYGQHTAIYCGLKESMGDYVITLDDDLQNPPEEIIHLIDKAQDGHDVVYGRFRQKKHAWYRRIGSSLISLINRQIFYQPKDIVSTNFRLIRRDVVNRVCGYTTRYPYITGLVIMFAANPANVVVDHAERLVGKSQYTPIRLIRLVMRILFNYSAWPLRMISGIGLFVAAISFILGTYYLIQGLLGAISVPGWTTVVVLLSFFNGISLLMLGMLGEYLIRLINETSGTTSYQILEVVKSE